MASSKSVKGGHRVQLVDDERLDIPDTLALAELNYDYISDVAAAMFGGSRFSGATLPVGGSMSRLVFNAATPSATTIYGPAGTSTSKAMFLYSYAAESGYHETQTLVYDPTATGQQTTVDLSSYTAGATPYIWAKRVDFASDVDTRKKWATGSPGSEITFSLATRERYRIQFSVTSSSSPPSSDVGWFCVAKVVAISGSTYTFRTVHPFDCGQEPTVSIANDWLNSTAKFSSAFELYTLSFIGTSQALYLLDQTQKLDKAALSTSIATNTANIATNAAGIAANATNIATNTANITSVADDVASNVKPVIPVCKLVLRNSTATPSVWTIRGISSSLGNIVAGDVTLVPTASGWKVELTFNAQYSFDHATASIGKWTNLASPLVAPGEYMVTTTTGPASFGTNTATKLNVYINTISSLGGGGSWESFPGSAPSGELALTIFTYRV